MTYLVTGATGFIGRFLVPELLKRDGDIHVLVRESSQGKLKSIAKGWGKPSRIKPVVGDLTAPNLGISDEWIAENAGTVTHMFHLAAIYDMTASEQHNRSANVDGTRHAVEVANALGVGCLHHVSSVAAAGMYEGRFTEDMFDEGQPLDHPYHATKFESEGIARNESTVPWRVYRPAVVLGHSKTGEMDKIDGPYYFFPAIKMGARLPDLLPLVGPRLGDTNVVPVDFVAAAMDHIAHEPGLNEKVFHLVNPTPQRSVDVINAFTKVAGAPKLVSALPAGVLALALKVPGVRSNLLPAVGIPGEVVDYVDFTATFDATNTMAALAGTDIRVPPLESYAGVLWDYWVKNMEHSS
jgi:thioester reductase-like protein